MPHGGLRGLKPTYTLLPSRISWPLYNVLPTLLSHYKHLAYQTMWLRLQTVGILNNVCAFSRQEHCVYQTTCPHWTNNCNIIPQKDTMKPFMAQPRHLLNSQVLPIFFHSATLPAMPYYLEFTDRYSPQYGRL